MSKPRSTPSLRQILPFTGCKVHGRTRSAFCGKRLLVLKPNFGRAAIGPQQNLNGSWVEILNQSNPNYRLTKTDSVNSQTLGLWLRI
jgi:hypothetical protein